MTPSPFGGSTSQPRYSYHAILSEPSPSSTPTSAMRCLRPPPPSPVVEKRARFFVKVVKSFSMHTLRPRPALPSMPIAIDNGVPHITFSLGSDPALDPTLCGLMDTCGALNTGYLLFHLWLMSERPDLVAEFISFDDSDPFEPIISLVVLFVTPPTLMPPIMEMAI